MRKLVFLDIDGTIVDYEGRVPRSAAAALRRAHDAGNLLFLCTGRSMSDIPSELMDLGIDGVIGGSGTYIEDAGEVLCHQPLDGAVEKDVVDWLRRQGIYFFLETNEGLFADEGFVEAALPAAEVYRTGPDGPAQTHVDADLACPPAIAALGAPAPDDDSVTVRSASMQTLHADELYRDDVNKVSFLLRSLQDVQDAKAAFPDLRVAPWGGKGEGALFAEIAPGGIDKATAVRRLVEHRGADMRDTIGFGDAAADIPMLQACAVGVAMGSGGAEIRAAADVVAGDVDADGLLNAFTELGLLENDREEI